MDVELIQSRKYLSRTDGRVGVFQLCVTTVICAAAVPADKSITTNNMMTNKRADGRFFFVRIPYSARIFCPGILKLEFICGLAIDSLCISLSIHIYSFEALKCLFPIPQIELERNNFHQHPSALRKKMRKREASRRETASIRRETPDSRQSIPYRIIKL